MGAETLRLGGKLEQGERSGIKLGSVLVLIKIPKRESQKERRSKHCKKIRECVRCPMLTTVI